MTTHPMIGLKTIREDLEVRAVDLAARIGCTMTTYYRYESGKRRIFFDHALALAQFLQVDVGMFTRIPTIDERAELWRRKNERKGQELQAGARLDEIRQEALEDASPIAAADPALTGTVVPQATQDAFATGAEQLGDESVTKDPALADLVAKWDFPPDD